MRRSSTSFRYVFREGSQRFARIFLFLLPAERCGRFIKKSKACRGPVCLCMCVYDWVWPETEWKFPLGAGAVGFLDAADDKPLKKAADL